LYINRIALLYIKRILLASERKGAADESFPLRNALSPDLHGDQPGLSGLA
jgi:hypothetical protein